MRTITVIMLCLATLVSGCASGRRYGYGPCPVGYRVTPGQAGYYLPPVNPQNPYEYGGATLSGTGFDPLTSEQIAQADYAREMAKRNSANAAEYGGRVVHASPVVPQDETSSGDMSPADKRLLHGLAKKVWEHDVKLKKRQTVGDDEDDN